MIDTTKPLYQRPDGSFVVTKNGLPFHVTNDMPERAAVLEWIEQGAIAEPEPQAIEHPEPTDDWLKSVIRSLEMQHMMSRPVREGLLASLQPGSAQHQRIKAVDDQIALLRQQLQ